MYKLENVNIEKYIEERPNSARKVRKRLKEVHWNDNQIIKNSLENILAGKLSEITLTVEDFITMLYIFSDQNAKKGSRRVPKIEIIFEGHSDLIKLLEHFQSKSQNQLNFLIKELEKEKLESANRSIGNIGKMISEIETLQENMKDDNYGVF